MDGAGKKSRIVGYPTVDLGHTCPNYPSHNEPFVFPLNKVWRKSLEKTEMKIDIFSALSKDYTLNEAALQKHSKKMQNLLFHK